MRVLMLPALSPARSSNFKGKGGVVFDQLGKGTEKGKGRLYSR